VAGKNYAVELRRNFAAFIAGSALLAGIVLAPGRPAFAAASPYRPPDIASASNIPYPPNTLAAGIVSFVLHLDDSGRMTDAQVTRDFPPLTKAAQAAIQGWSYTPARLRGKAVPSSIQVSVVFNVFDPNGVKMNSLKLTPPAPLLSDELQFTPPQIASASFANYPPKTVSSGTVVLDVSVNEAGEAKKIRVVQGAPPLTSAAELAVKSWAFSPATFQGRAIPSHAVVAFVFQINNPVASPTD
jgi:TonB family protein